MEYLIEGATMPRSYRSGEEKFNVIMESFNNPDISIEEISKNQGIALPSLIDHDLRFIDSFTDFKKFK